MAPTAAFRLDKQHLYFWKGTFLKFKGFGQVLFYDAVPCTSAVTMPDPLSIFGQPFLTGKKLVSLVAPIVSLDLL